MDVTKDKSQRAVATKTVNAAADGPAKSHDSNDLFESIKKSEERRNSIDVAVITPDSSGPKEEEVEIDNEDAEVTEEEISQENRQGLLKMFTKAIGLDITTIAVPVTMNEPASFLMRLCESIQYCDLLDKASICENSLERLMYVTIFAASCYAVAERTGKPFNPLLGETYEYVEEDYPNGFRFIAEQVSHHPPIGACHAENCNWKFWQSQCLRTKFMGNSLDCSVEGCCNCYLSRTEENFKWECVKTCVHNVIVGKMWIDHYGEIDIVNKSNGEKARLRMKQCGWFSKGWHEMEADIMDTKGTIGITLYGKWNEAIYGRVKEGYHFGSVDSGNSNNSTDSANSSDTESSSPRQNNSKDDFGNNTSEPSNEKTSSKKEKKLEKREKKERKKEQKKEEEQRKKELKRFKKEIKKKLTSEEPLWTHTYKPLPPERLSCKYMIDWTERSLQIVAINAMLRAILPATDSRVRPDRLALEQMDVKKASADKHILEERQRDEKKARDRSGKKYSPKYFKLSKDSDGQEVWKYIGGYWEAREQRVKAYYSKNNQNNVNNSSNNGINSRIGKESSKSNRKTEITSESTNANPNDNTSEQKRNAKD